MKEYREPILEDIIRRALEHEAYRNEGCLQPQHAQKSSSIQEMVERYLLEQAYRNDSR